MYIERGGTGGFMCVDFGWRHASPKSSILSKFSTAYLILIFRCKKHPVARLLTGTTGSDLYVNAYKS